MEKNSQIDLKSLIAVSIIGYIIVLIITYVERILASSLKIIGYLTNVKPNILFFSDIIPSLIISIFWIILIFKYLKDFSGVINIKEDIYKKKLIRLGYIVILLFIISLSLMKLENYSIQFYNDSLEWGITEHAKNFFIVSLFNFLELIIIVFGFLKIIKNNY